MPGGDYFYRARPGAPRCLVAFGDVIDQRHLFAAEQLFDIHKDQHALAERAKTGEILGRQRHREFRRRRICSAVSDSTSETPSTTIPTTRWPKLSTITTVFSS